MYKDSTSHYLSQEERLFIIFEHNQKTSYTNIIEKFEKKFGKTIHRSTISRICEKEKETDSVKDLEKTGRLRIYDEREERPIVRGALKQNKESITNLTQNQFINPKEACKSIINSILLSHNVHSLVRSRRLADLSKGNVKDRKRFAKTHIHWTESDWKLVIFSDEADLMPVYQGREYVRLRG